MGLKEYRNKSGFTQEQVAKLSDLSIKYISEMENGRRNPSDKTKNKLAKIYKVSAVDIFLACQRTNRSKTKKEANT